MFFTDSVLTAVKLLISKAGTAIANLVSSTPYAQEATVKMSKILAPIAAAAVFAFASVAAQATPVFELRVSDGVNPDLIILDDAPGLDQSPTSGSILWAGSFGSYLLNIASGTSIVNPLAMHLGAIVQVLGTPTSTLTFTLTQTNLDAGAGPTVLGFATSGGGSGPNSVSWATYVDDSNVAFGTATQLFSTSSYNGSGSSTASLSDAYSASIQATFDYRGATIGKSGSLDISLDVPEPTTIALVGAALVGLGLARRRSA